MEDIYRDDDDDDDDDDDGDDDDGYGTLPRPDNDEIAAAWQRRSIALRRSPPLRETNGRTNERTSERTNERSRGASHLLGGAKVKDCSLRGSTPRSRAAQSRGGKGGGGVMGRHGPSWAVIEWWSRTSSPLTNE